MPAFKLIVPKTDKTTTGSSTTTKPSAATATDSTDPKKDVKAPLANPNSKVVETTDIFNNPDLVRVVKDTAKNRKQPATDNQDAADACVVTLPADKKPDDVLPALKASTMATGEELRKKYLSSGACFTACAITNASGKYRESHVHLGDTGVCRVIGTDFLDLTPTQHSSDAKEVDKLIAAGHRNNIIGNQDSLFIYNGYNFHQRSELPANYEHYLGGYIFIENEPFNQSKLYYVNRITKQPEPIAINNFVGFASALKSIRTGRTFVLELLTFEKLNKKFWTITKSTDRTNTTLRLSGVKLLNLLNNCVPHDNLSAIAATDVITGRGNARCFGNGEYAAISFEPDASESEINVDDIFVLYTDGVTDNLSFKAIVQLSKTFGVCKQAYETGTTDDITSLIATELAKLKPGQILLLLIADGHGNDGHHVANEAIEKFKMHFCAKLGIKIDDVVVKVISPRPATNPPLPLNPAMFTAAAPTHTPPPTSQPTETFTAVTGTAAAATTLTMQPPS